MLQPTELKSDEKLTWSAGRGTDVWALFQACAAGDLATVQALIAKDPALARAHYEYRKPLYFAVRENRVDVARFLLEHDSNPMDLWIDEARSRSRGTVAMRPWSACWSTRWNEVQRVGEGRAGRIGTARPRPEEDARAARCRARASSARATRDPTSRFIGRR